MLLIATDEAGYGPKLGPLVIAGTAWSVPGEELGTDELTAMFAPLRAAQTCGSIRVHVDDSKAVFKPSGGLESLHAVVSACMHWCGRLEPTLSELLPQLARGDAALVRQTPWLSRESGLRFLDQQLADELVTPWRGSGLQLLDVQARIITAAAFNEACQNGLNKADLLSASTLGLVRQMLESRSKPERRIAVYCDRHGGRRYYASVLQHVFPDAGLQVSFESKHQSAYRLTTDASEIDVFFTVKGDSFTPVALSSMHAKYLRERLMESLNAYFAERHDQPGPIKPTAGYPVDADRFLVEIAPILRREKIDLRRFVRSR